MLLTAPRDGKTPLVDNPSQLADCAATLSPGAPIAIDTERASGYTYDDRAYLIQLRQEGIGTFLIDAEALRDDLPPVLAPAVNACPWVLHAAVSDIPCLADVGMTAPTLFDTEVAGRFLGFDKVNLAAMTNRILGIDLKKGHAAENWSKRPIPRSWLIYAALDVELLIELADTLTALLEREGKLAWAEAEFQHIIDCPPHHHEKTWLDVKGIRRMHGPQVQAARALFNKRELIAYRKGIAPGRVLSNKLLSLLAEKYPTTAEDVDTILHHRSDPSMWADVIRRSLALPREKWTTLPHEDGTPAKSAWKRLSPEAWDALHNVTAAIADHAQDLQMDPIVLVSPALVRDAVWQRVFDGDSTPVAEILRDRGARDWQIDQVGEIIEDFLP
ncbi:MULTISPECIES: HRDC domain-containing protein [Corynebacterium]|uniref:Ribonuclease D n=2 Tax=Corynebacterium glucuronolyticum TaxID=39791 RepID=A0A7T4JUA3_9CORY|nr:MULTISPECIES: HRDC domain-containing protein [Corynebacterium]EEI26498.1 3'-5' exonuclease [Corynebacterium glucuronolyticum ATCC 51867]EEI63040.1 3'-5' exonuclease [Corynebacterium glucuronolyticum ATCC 51866]MCT1564217.1 HRDC domain-containing protein [Corynebacterium glucuronolyticum]OFO43219.1 ribonuclease D [Corynebacterium sp. HMSC073D01]QQB45617.1 ribonuclease D [Corynebacterium glucuronolyticum]